MIALIQRVSSAEVTVEGRAIGSIGRGILALVGMERGDGSAQAERLLERVLSYRIFEDADGRMNHSLRDVGGGLLLVPQFTLAADTHQGTRPGFSSAAEPTAARALFDGLLVQARARHACVATGAFGAHMQVSLVNDGPVTFWLKTAPDDKDLTNTPGA